MAMFHLTLRVPWHDNRWNGTICRFPILNSFCTSLDRIREKKEPEAEEALVKKGRIWWGELQADQLPPCKAESGAFMNEREWTRVSEHPYANIEKAARTHGHLKPTPVKVLPYSTFAVPFRWMLRGNQKAIQESLSTPLPEDEKPPFDSSWVFGKARQEALVKLFFDDRLRGEKSGEASLVIFYVKVGQPLDESISRLVVGVGRILKIHKLQWYLSQTDDTYPMWDRLVHHSVRPDKAEGFLLPYHDYLEPTGDSQEDQHRLKLLEEITVAAADEHLLDFSYAAELVKPGVVLTTLKGCLEAVRKIKKHGIAKGPWDKREEWLNAQIARLWKERGAFPGAGSALEALGLRLATCMCLDLMAAKEYEPDDDPWPVLDAVIRGRKKPPSPAYKADLEAVRNTWTGLTEDRKNLLKLLSRFDLSPAQAKRWFDEAKRRKATEVSINDAEILLNPYRICETDLGGRDDLPVPIGTIDQGVFPDSTIAAKHPLEGTTAVRSVLDARRIRAALVTVLRNASAGGDTLLSAAEALARLERLPLSQPCQVGTDWLNGNREALAGVVDTIEVPVQPESDERITALQFTEMWQKEEKLRKKLRARAEKASDSIEESWEKLLVQAIQKTGGELDLKNERHKGALTEQAAALTKLMHRRLTVLTGSAGTGKTSALGALFGCEQLKRQGILLLAPTGKARVRLARATGAEAMTVAQFLYSLHRYDGERQRPLFNGDAPYKEARTVVIDECSMLTVDDLLATLEALDLGHVRRLILVGDPNQLPPIGPGRPFADLVGFLRQARDSKVPEVKHLAEALCELTVEVRTSAGVPSDALRLARLFASGPLPVDADEILNDLESKEKLNDLSVTYWKKPDELRALLLGELKEHLPLKALDDVEGFNRALGVTAEGYVLFGQPDGAEYFQILSPVRMHPYGVHELNRWIQRMFRRKELEGVLNPYRTKLGDDDLVLRDKVIQVRNQYRHAWDTDRRLQCDQYVANGEVGVVGLDQKSFLKVVYAGRPNLTFSYSGRDFPSGEGPLELAYALTVHKSQGSDFRKVFVVIPKECGILSRELLYTALTRSRDQLVLLIEGDSVECLNAFRDRSDTARRNTNLFVSVVRVRLDEIPYADHLIHRAEKGHLVRSKSELVIANTVFRMKLKYEYESRLEFEGEPRIVHPDFTFVDAAGDKIVWEHLGMLHHQDYRERWERRQRHYEKNGFELGKNLFTTQDDEHGGLDSRTIVKVAEQIQSLL